MYVLGGGGRRIVQVILRSNLDDGLGSILIVIVIVECFDQNICEKSENKVWY